MISKPNCPLSSSMTSCSPKCKEDSECFGRKCCSNICNTKSCVPANHKDNQNNGYKNQNSKSALGSYCGNVKCSSFEKCDFDKTTKRQKCVRT
ncbi:waprin-Thr1 isoform X2 [Leptinotarsa decemlineata]|uniref:waprin-Thr1 isoform X2 n=1 Tax=Leptinotarsa decemlineata TaxID=7539 RepID=UPI003D309294